MACCVAAEPTAGGYDKVVAENNRRAQAARDEEAALERQMNTTLEAISGGIGRMNEKLKELDRKVKLLTNG